MNLKNDKKILNTKYVPNIYPYLLDDMHGFESADRIQVTYWDYDYEFNNPYYNNSYINYDCYGPGVNISFDTEIHFYYFNDTEYYETTEESIFHYDVSIDSRAVPIVSEMYPHLLL